MHCFGEAYRSWHERLVRSGFRWMALAAALLLSLSLAGCFDHQKDQGGNITLYGNVDIREVQLAFQDSGRIARLLVDEGAVVKKGEVIAELDPVRFQLDVDRLKGAVQAQKDLVTRMHNGSRPQEIEQAKAEVDAAKASLKEAQLTYDRKKILQVTNHISQQEVDNARAQVDVWTAKLHGAQDALSLAVAGPRKEDISVAEANLQSLIAQQELAQQRLTDTKLLAPVDGVIRSRILEPGAMAAPGTPVFTLAMTDPLWVRVYVNEPDLGRMHEGMPAQIHTDSYPGTSFTGWIGFISSTAEFTPKTVETTELRTKLVYRTRVFACDPKHQLRLGMPVTVSVDTSKAPQKTPACGE